MVAGDNLFSEPLADLPQPAQGLGRDPRDLRCGRSGGDEKIFRDQDRCGRRHHPFRGEAGETRRRTLTGIALYYFAAETLELFTTYIAAGNNPDQPGRFIQWLYTRRPVKTYQIKGTWYDIGSKETLEEANKIFAQFAK